MDVEFSQDQTEQTTATAWLSKSYINFLTLFTDKEVNICGGAKSTTGDAECPAAGNYEISTDVDIPEYNGYVTGFQAHVKLSDGNGDTMLNCSATLRGGYGINYSFAAAVCGAALCGFFLRRRRKNGRVVTASEEDHDNFEMMKDPPVLKEQHFISSKGVTV
eukprot:CAMPEP_0172497896 /NCGR_PEP_ID=MMETSP1066-20121228/106748_1 /TAXON_ID=671091 /ORGANISM="Coscinodiscus wailesii, Strain CCMP2513" /LENGTH=161 /DNA_ID=CAMNT_0013270921 /DNA_START=310 /DNA_END=795 /DNA_ORIENTATION=+